MKKNILLITLIFSLTQLWSKNLENAVDSLCTVTVAQLPGTTCLQATATGTAPFVFLWENGSTGEMLCANNPNGGVYCVTMMDANGCAATACGQINPNGNFCDVWISQDSVFFGIELTAQPTGVAPFAYLWNTGQTDPSIVVSQPGTYCVTITDDNNCQASSCVTIDDNNNTNCSVTIEYTPAGALIAVASGTAPLTYAWSNNENTEIIFPNAIGTYCVTITDADGCVADACYFYNGGNNDTFCYVIVSQLPGTWCLEATGYGTAPFTYIWENGSTGSTYCPNTPNGGTFCVTMADANGCISTACGTLGNNNQDSCWVQILDSNTGDLYASTNPLGGNAVAFLWSTGETTQSITPPAPGIYCVTVTMANGCQATDCLETNFSGQILGYVVIENDTVNTGANGTAFLIYYDPDEESLTAVDEVSVNQGIFIFNNVPAGEYLVKAALSPNSLGYENYFPTYFNQVLWWNEATAIEVIANSSYTLELNMVEGDNPGGPGFIGGLVSEGANFSGGADHRGDGDPLANVTMLLLDENDNPISHTVTNAQGEYQFDNLAWGTYKVYIEITGIEHVMYLVTIGPENPSVNNLDFIVDENSAATVSIKDLLEENSIQIYPNPTNNVLNLQMTVKESSAVIFSLMNVEGKTVFAQAVDLYPGVYTHSFDMEKLPAGLYFVNIIDGKETISRKVIKD